MLRTKPLISKAMLEKVNEEESGQAGFKDRLSFGVLLLQIFIC
jgi:hypothetical protein